MRISRSRRARRKPHSVEFATAGGMLTSRGGPSPPAAPLSVASSSEGVRSCPTLPHAGSFSFGRVLLLVVPLALVGVGREDVQRQPRATKPRPIWRHTMVSRLLGHGRVRRDAQQELQGRRRRSRRRRAGRRRQGTRPRGDQLLLRRLQRHRGRSGDVEGVPRRPGRRSSAARSNWSNTPTPDEQLRALKNGELHVTAFATGEAQGAVNEAGFVPAACFADKDGDYHYTMKIIVPADSEIKKRRATSRASG